MPLDMLRYAETAPVPVPFWHIVPTDSPETQVRKFAYGVILDKSRWCRNVVARDSNRAEVDPTSAMAVRYCAYGAMLRGEQVLGLPKGTAAKAKKAVDYVNDVFGHRMTMRYLERKIRLG